MLLVFLLCFASASLAQDEPNILFLLKNKADLPQLLAKYQLQEPQELIPNSHFYQAKTGRRGEQETLLQLLREEPMLQAVQGNRRFEARRSSPPDDSLFSLQWTLWNQGGPGHVPGNDIGVYPLWLEARGDTNARGDTIVAAVLDDGLDASHLDFLGNLYTNSAEIPNNGIDDDGNGYIDDYWGWNALDQTDEVLTNGGSGHGTSVAGIVAARGYNGRGVLGVSPFSQLMIIRNDFNTSEAAVLRAYGYAWQQRKDYNQSGGQRGSYVVVTNASWGLDFGRPADAPLWCALFDSLGKEGILSVAAAANRPLDLDVYGDLPCTCPSPYLITVTNLNRFNDLANDASFGAQSVDIGSYGDGTYTTKTGNSYGTFRGCSAAAPHVAGGVALLYSLLCDSLLDIGQQNPGALALLLKEALLEGGRETGALRGKTVSGKRLYLLGSARYLDAICDTVLAARPQYQELPIRSYPNPLSPGQAPIVQSPRAANWRLYTSLGQFVAEGRLEAGEQVLQPWPIYLSAGLYFLQLEGQVLQLLQAD